MELSETEILLRSLRGGASLETVEARVRRYIVEHALRPGDRLPSEAELVTALRSSRVVIREALHGLEALGVLESRVGSGWYVRAFEVRTAARAVARSLAFHPNALLDLLAVRNSTEADLVAGIAGRVEAADFAVLDELVARMAWRAGRDELFSEEDGEFHRRLIAIDGNLVALALVDLYFGMMEVVYQQGLPGPSAADRPAVIAAHRQIVDALRRGDGQEARHAMILSNNNGRRRLIAWRDAHMTGENGAGRSPIDVAVQSALLWPGIR
jgi:DNA-binding FadR family transcriptional regulator